ncbi:uncharacterized protein Gasu_18130, partial [Galdieria sulphuraria]
KEYDNFRQDKIANTRKYNSSILQSTTEQVKAWNQ